MAAQPPNDEAQQSYGDAEDMFGCLLNILDEINWAWGSDDDGQASTVNPAQPIRAVVLAKPTILCPNGLLGPSAHSIIQQCKADGQAAVTRVNKLTCTDTV